MSSYTPPVSYSNRREKNRKKKTGDGNVFEDKKKKNRSPYKRHSIKEESSIVKVPT